MRKILENQGDDFEEVVIVNGVLLDPNEGEEDDAKDDPER